MRGREIGAVVLSLVMLPALSADEPDGSKQIVRERSGRKWALLVGVNDYANASKLRYCVDDMHAFGEQLVAAGFPREHVFTLYDGAKEARNLPLGTNIRRQLNLLLGTLDAGGTRLKAPGLVEKGDLVVVAFSGHGLHMDDTSFLCPTDADLEAPSSLVSVERIYRQLELSGAGAKLLLVDACRNDPRPEGDKDFADRADIKAFSTHFDSPPRGILVLSSCAPGQRSWEDPELRHGVFFNYLVEGLRGAADSEKGDRDERVSLLELYRYAEEKTKLRVAHTRSTAQTPRLRGEIEGDFDFGRAGLAKTYLSETTGLEMVLVKAGEFQMGSPADELQRQDDETPRRVRITRPFYLGKYEVTQAEFQQIMGRNPSYYSPDGEGKDDVAGEDTRQFPVEIATWFDGVEFCNKLSAADGLPLYYRIENIEREADETRVGETGGIRSADVTIAGGAGYRLPTESEWEYACRAGTTTPFHFGKTSDASHANIYGNYPEETEGEFLARTTAVGSYAANAWGLCDMHGNAWEWCQDWYAAPEEGDEPLIDPAGPRTGTQRVLRGGSFNSTAWICRSAARYKTTPEWRLNMYGLRVARTP